MLTLWVLVALAALFPKDMLAVVDFALLHVKSWFLNAQLFVRAYFLYCSIKKTRDKMGLATPPFHFTPIWNREDR